MIFFPIKTSGLSYFIFSNFFLPKLCENTNVKMYSNWIQCPVVSFPSTNFSEIFNFFYLDHRFLLVEAKPRCDCLCTTSGGLGDYHWFSIVGRILVNSWVFQAVGTTGMKGSSEIRDCVCVHVYICASVCFMCLRGKVKFISQSIQINSKKGEPSEAYVPT